MNVARGGFGAIEAQQRYEATRTAAWAAQQQEWADADKAGTSGSKRADKLNKDQKAADAAAQINHNTPLSEDEKWVEALESSKNPILGGENKAPILQATDA